MRDRSNLELIKKASTVVNARKFNDYTVGDVGCALLTDKGHVYLGVCIDAGSGIGFCAEHSAIAAMVTAGEFCIRKIVAVWKHGQDIHILAPCGRCREFIRQIHQGNLETEIILGIDFVKKLSEILPFQEWSEKVELP